MTQEEKILHDKVLYFMKTESEYTNNHKLFIANEILRIINQSGLELNVWCICAVRRNETLNYY